MPGQFARLGLAFAGFLILSAGLLLLLFLRPGTAEFVITVLTFGLGCLLGAISALVLHIERKRS
ncbi:hypothetical protein LX16_3931 [Stackebrandtia albiflava]|uniref:Uncharacterized protein n=1 Tax=Stackebrandtia albiflava TaxID=406432 RepID=A0A562UXZ5_9ACTN|nr:hypothetical protein [Stackebrandtia albiflava]TWJ10514.1 hypothetical protein LX16_3931 [Stackebrandtia albiflava]